MFCVAKSVCKSSHVESPLYQLHNLTTGDSRSSIIEDASISKGVDHPHYVQAPHEYLHNLEELWTRSSARNQLQSPIGHNFGWDFFPTGHIGGLGGHGGGLGGHGGGLGGHGGGLGGLGGSVGALKKGKEAKTLFILMAPLILLAVFGPILATQAMIPWVANGGLTSVSTIAGGRRRGGVSHTFNQSIYFPSWIDLLPSGLSPTQPVSLKLRREKGSKKCNVKSLCSIFTDRQTQERFPGWQEPSRSLHQFLV
ncbi:hypothetical protein CEXT_64391 [Caerostris extrusa]|uniref:Uncharacterized protein n=1 Tax=Caerostris extrusa TaxID=172846 RepID=A0AAV4PLJ6_CAEEX|nr:hypothetical protein CEXT_64391 [Caerostris extrusa]